MIAKTLSGLPFLDLEFGGVYAGRSTLVCGRSGTGKTIASLHFIQQGIEQAERSLILSTMPANDLVILAGSLGFNFTPAIEHHDLIMLEYQSFVPGTTIGWKTIPAEGYTQLREIIETNSISRLVLDSVLPWIMVAETEHMAEQVFSFVRSCDRLGVTTLMTIPKPVSNMAFRLKKTLESNTPVSVLLSPGEQAQQFTWHTVKYLGDNKSTFPQPYMIERGRGIVPVQVAPTAGTTEDAAMPGTAMADMPAGPARVRFSSRVPVGQTAPAGEAGPATVKGPVRLSSTWKPQIKNQP